MQYRRQANKIQVYAYCGYDKEKRRAIVRLLGSFNASTLEVPEELMKKLTDDQKKELLEYIEEERQAREFRSRLHNTKDIANYLRQAAKCIEATEFPVTEEWAEQVYQNIGALQRALRRAGYPKKMFSKRKQA